MGAYAPGDTYSLSDFIAPFLSHLDTFQPVARTFADTFDTDNKTYFDDSNALVNQKIFWGFGSQAFLVAVSKQIGDSQPLVRGLRHISAQTLAYRQEVDATTSHYAGQLGQVDAGDFYPQMGIGSMRDLLVADTLLAVDLNSLLKSGSSAIAGPLAAATSSFHATIDRTVPIALSRYGATPDKQVEQAQITSYQNMLAGISVHVGTILKSWADELYHATSKYLSIIPNVDSYISVGDMFLNIFGGNGPTLQNTNRPISIIPFKMPDGSTRLLVLIAGTDGFHQYYADNIPRAFEFGNSPNPDAPYLKDVEGAVLNYLNEHPEIQNPHVTLMGYSLGGMVSQYLANEASTYGTGIDSVVAVGSPVMTPPVEFSPTTGVNYQLYMGTGDLIPLLSEHEIEGSTLSGGRLDRVSKAYQMNWNDKLHQYIDPYNQYGNSIIPVSDIPFKKDSILSELTHLLPNHVEYQNSNFLENQDLTSLNGATQSGVPEYFPVTNFSK